MGNQGYISSLKLNPGVNDHLIDNQDAIHSGIIKALNIMTQGSYVAYGFDVSQAVGTGGDTETVYTVSNGGYFRNGLFSTFTQTTVTKATATATSNGDYYVMLVLDSSNALQIRGTSALGSSTPVGASPEDGDIPIAMIRIETGQTNINSREIQYLTSKTLSKSLSLGYSNSNIYNEALTITANATKALFTSVGDFEFKLPGTSATDIFKITDNAGSPQTQFSITGEGNATIENDLAVGGNTTITGNLTAAHLYSTYLSSTDSLIFRVDYDESTTPHTSIYQFRNGANGSVFEITESGDATLTNNFIFGGNIQKSGGAGLSADILNQATVSGTVNFANYAGTVLIGAVAGLVSVGILKSVNNTIQDSLGTSSITFSAGTSVNMGVKLNADNGIHISKSKSTEKSVGFAATLGTNNQCGHILWTDALATPLNLAHHVHLIGSESYTHDLSAYSPVGTGGHQSPTVNTYNDEIWEGFSILSPANDVFGGSVLFTALPPAMEATAGLLYTIKNVNRHTNVVVICKHHGYDGVSVLEGVIEGGNENRGNNFAYVSNRVVSLKSLLNVANLPSPTVPDNMTSAIILRPMETITVMPVSYGLESEANYNDWGSQGHSANPTWILLNDNSGGLAHTTYITSGYPATVYLSPVFSGMHYFVGQNGITFTLPSNAQLGTQYLFQLLSPASSLTVSCQGSQSLTDGTATNTNTIAGSAKTFTYLGNNIWSIIG